MINYNAESFLNKGLSIYNRYHELEDIADQITKKGYSNIFITSIGGSLAMMAPFEIMIQSMSPIPVYTVLSSTLILNGHNQLSKNSLIFMASKSGDTCETLAAAHYLSEIGCPIFSLIGNKNSPLEEVSQYSFVYEEGRPQELAYYILVSRLLYNQGYFDSYHNFIKELKNLPQVLNDVREQSDPYVKDVSQKYKDQDYSIWVASSYLWPVCYAYSMCVLEESLWMRTKSVQSEEFFHGTLELVEKDVYVFVLIGESQTRELDERVKSFVQKYSQKAILLDTKDYIYQGISDQYRDILSPVVMNAILQRLSKNLELDKHHSLNIRRYYRKVDY